MAIIQLCGYFSLFNTRYSLHMTWNNRAYTSKGLVSRSACRRRGTRHLPFTSVFHFASLLITKAYLYQHRYACASRACSSDRVHDYIAGILNTRLAHPSHSKFKGNMATVPTTTPNSIFETAHRKLKDSVSSAHADAFQTTSFEEVWTAAEEIEKAHEARGNLRNMRRIAPFLKGLQNYSKVIEVLCNGTPYMPWIWVSLAIPSLILRR